MSFGWIITFIGVGLVNLYLIYHYLIFKTKTSVKVIVTLMHLALAIICVIYFVNYFNGNTGTPAVTALSYIAGAYICMLTYLGIVFFIYDLARLLGKFIKYPETLINFNKKIFKGGLLAILIAALCTMPAFFIAKDIETTSYEVEIESLDSELDELHAVAISDAHIGSAIKEKEIHEIVNKIRSMSPDIVFLVGDIFDEGTTHKMKLEFVDAFSEIEPEYGIYFVTGNHEFATTEGIKEEMSHIKNADITIIHDDVITLDGLLNIVGRDDQNGQNRADLNKLADKIDPDLPTIILDHRPEHKEAEKLLPNALQLSGHTHNGQIFPFHIFTFAFGPQYGYHEFGSFQLIVSSGVGTYGVPMRLGSPNEIVDVKISCT